MKKNILVIFFTLAAALSLAACAAAQPTQASSPAQDTPNAPAGGNSANNIDNRLAVGILKMEGTPQEVTAYQAKQMLPLWQQVKSLTTSGTPAPDQLQTVYQQIQAALDPDQIQTISAMSLTQADMQTMMASLGIQAPQGNFPTLSPEQQATRTARQTQNPNGGGFGAGGGYPSGGFNGTPRAGRTPGAGGGFSGGGRGGGMNMIFVDPLIQLLQKRAAS